MKIFSNYNFCGEGTGEEGGRELAGSCHGSWEWQVPLHRLLTMPVCKRHSG